MKHMDNKNSLKETDFFFLFLKKKKKIKPKSLNSDIAEGGGTFEASSLLRFLRL